MHKPMVMTLGLLAGAGWLATPVVYADHDDRDGACSKTSMLMRSACQAEVRDDYLVEKAKCLNESERNEKRECLADAKGAWKEDGGLCDEQLESRIGVCDAIGEAPYDPSFEAEDFETSLSSITIPNRYFPMGSGYTWTYGGDEDIVVTTLDETKLIDDITCFVLRDVVSVDGRLVEDTNDWFGISRIDGSIWYCGEEVKDYEYFEGDSPSTPELVAIDGSFKVERDGDRAGVFFPGILELNKVYRQEFSLGNAEDIGEVISTNYRYGNDPELDQDVPQDLVDYLCNDDCVVVYEYTPIEPDVFERKYYAPGIGFFLGTKPQTHETVQLTGCSFNALCANLPEPH